MRARRRYKTRRHLHTKAHIFEYSSFSRDTLLRALVDWDGRGSPQVQQRRCSIGV